MKRFLLLCLAGFIFTFSFFASSSIVSAACDTYNPNSPSTSQSCPLDASLGGSFDCGANLSSTCVCSSNVQCTYTDLGYTYNRGRVISVTPKSKTLSCGQVSPNSLDVCGCGGTSSFSAVPGTSVKCCGYLSPGSSNGCSATPVAATATCSGSCYGSSLTSFPGGTACWGKVATSTCYVCPISGGTFIDSPKSQCANAAAPGSGTSPTNPSNPGTPPVGSCDGCSDLGTCRDYKKGTFTQYVQGGAHPECAPQGGYCNGTTVCGGGGGTAPAPVTGNLVCGDACTSSSQCRNPSGNGSPVACINGTCQNTMCAEGKTIPGGNCSCGANTRKCGQSCSGTVGLCGPGQGTCTYVNPPSHWYTGAPDCAWGSAAYCVGTQNGFSRVQCTTGDAPGGGYARDPSGNVKTIDTSTLAPSCQVCGNGDVEINEQCDDGKLNGTGCGCSKTCEHFTMALSANGTNDQVTVASGSNVTLDWKTAGMTSCVAQDGWTGEKALAGTETINNAVANTQYTLKCLQNGTNRPVYSSVVVNITGKTAAPVINFKINGSSAPIVYGKPVNWATQFGVFNAYFNWTTSGATSCVGMTNPSPQTVYPFPGGVPYKMSASVAGWFLFDQTQPVNLTSKTAALSVINDAGTSKYGVFKLSCTGLGGTTTKTIVVVTDKTPSKQVCAAPGTFVTPPPTTAPLVCSMPVTITSTGNKDSWKIGDMITFSLPAVSVSSIPSGATLRYEGEVRGYRGSTQILSKVLTPINATASQFTPIQISAVNATYYYHFRYCVKSSSGIETCSAWGEWTLPTPPPAKTVKLIKDGTTGWIDVDAINENGGLTQQTSSRFAYTGSWATDTNAVYSGGSSTYTGTAGATITFSTTASSVKLMTTRASNRASFDVYVNGVKKATVSTINSTRQDQYVIDLTPYL